MVDRKKILTVARRLVAAGHTELAREVVSFVLSEDEVDAGVSVQHIQGIAKELLDKFFKEYNLPVPEIRIKNNLGAKWIGQQTCRQGFDSPATSLIEIQKAAIDDERTLRRVLTHELIHHYQCFHSYDLFKNDSKEFLPYQRMLTRFPHGGDFKEFAAKINSVMGDNFVSEKSDEEDVLSVPKDFYIVIVPERSDYMYARFQRTGVKKDLLEEYRTKKKAKVFQTNNRRLTRGPVFSKKGEFGIPKDQPTKDLLKDMYEHGTEVSI